MLSHFSVKNYKCLADVSLPLTPIHVLIGQNDTGKTSLFEAIRVGSWLSTRFSTNPGAPQSMKFGDGRGGFLRSIFPGKWDIPEFIWRNAEELEFVLTFGGKRYPELAQPDFSISCSLREHKQTIIRAFPTLSFIGFRNEVLRLRPNMMSRPSVLNPRPRYSLFEDGFGLPTLLSEIADYHAQKFIDIQLKFKEYFRQFIQIRLESTLGWERVEQNEYEVDKPTNNVGKQVVLVTNESEIRLQHASDGAILLLGFLAVMNSPKPPDIILIEEPENGIHPKRLQEIAKLLKTFVSQEKNAPQIIMTTHSPYLLSEFQPEEVTLMRRQPDGSAKAFPLRDAPHIRERMGNEFYLGELWYNLDEEDLLK